jgi:acetate kinase
MRNNISGPAKWSGESPTSTKSGRRIGWNWDEVNKLLNKRSGLLGLSELSNECRKLETAANRDHAGAQVGLEVFVYRLARRMGGLAIALPRLDAVVFPGARTWRGSVP